jgi:hypothetical protein
MGENLGYALIQIAHNFGAVAVLGGAACGRWPARAARDAGLGIAWLVLAGWLMQIASGAAFGAASYANYGQLPDIHGVAVAALLVKIGCAIAGVAVTITYLRRAPHAGGLQRELAWTVLVALAAIALVAAAFLRWFS